MIWVRIAPHGIRHWMR